MSILIKGMKMPTSCAECYFLVERFTGNEFVNECDLQWHSGRFREQVDEECEMHTKSEGCPLIEVPTPHGRLIDETQIPYIDLNADMPQSKVRVWTTFKDKIDRLPTIIEAEEVAS